MEEVGAVAKEMPFKDTWFPKAWLVYHGEVSARPAVELHAPAEAGESPAVIENQPPTCTRAGHSARGHSVGRWRQEEENFQK